MEFLKLSKYNLVKIYFLFLTSIFFLLGFSTTVSAQKKYTVVLDAGHGGKDSGASRGSYKEKKIALQVVLDLGKELLTSKDIKVIYTRKTDDFIELHNRAKIANTKKADLFVSVHCNANNSSKPHGAETYVLGLNGNKENLEISRKENAVILLEDNYKQNYDYDPNSPESLIGLSVLQEENLDLSLGFGGLVQTNFKSLKRYNRKVKQANFLVLRETVMPSVLIELGFLSNKTEGKFLNSRTGQIRMAKAIAKAIKKYIKRLQLNKVQDNYIVKTEKKRTPLKIVVKPKKKSTAEKVVVKKVVKKPIEKVVVKKTPAGVRFKVQIAASRKYIKEASYNFKGLKNVELMFIDNYYKYYYGSTAVYTEIKKVLIEAKKVGYKDAWVVAFKDDQKISIKEALKNL
ncbi:N-acetylmuramoyl-L-alanine amidase [Tenacibaculum sp. Bg11-29]|uniref:N-acetylmuramoyl-L-alanine amidase family protein n=1 Tax=Tenacibaculum sp. Bg11-29 TaxID=2058306 RepID=UPI000C330A0E|nr:N-acetylmuramoyl-L-alanine amidase [Tenacibaculum sp. Bg11-29]PKH51355.1 N-acetylmuramoyl-L-alanine amidase [Tenacibaculum sp. Bg11-29]